MVAYKGYQLFDMADEDPSSHDSEVKRKCNTRIPLIEYFGHTIGAVGLALIQIEIDCESLSPIIGGQERPRILLSKVPKAVISYRGSFRYEYFSSPKVLDSGYSYPNII